MSFYCTVGYNDNTNSKIIIFTDLEGVNTQTFK